MMPGLQPLDSVLVDVSVVLVFSRSVILVVIIFTDVSSYCVVVARMIMTSAV